LRDYALSVAVANGRQAQVRSLRHHRCRPGAGPARVPIYLRDTSDWFQEKAGLRPGDSGLHPSPDSRQTCYSPGTPPAP